MELFEIRDEIIHDGVCVARMRLLLPDMDGNGGRFYHKLAEKASGWFTDTFSHWAISDYELCDDERKKWRYDPAVFYIKSDVGERADKYICHLEAICKRQGKGANRRTRIHVWCKRHGRMTPCLSVKMKK